MCLRVRVLVRLCVCVFVYAHAQSAEHQLDGPSHQQQHDHQRDGRHTRRHTEVTHQRLGKSIGVHSFVSHFNSTVYRADRLQTKDNTKQWRSGIGSLLISCLVDVLFKEEFTRLQRIVAIPLNSERLSYLAITVFKRQCMILNGVLVSYSKDLCQLHRTDIVNKVIAATTNIVSKAISGRMSVSLRVCVHVFTHSLQP